MQSQARTPVNRAVIYPSNLEGRTVFLKTWQLVVVDNSLTIQELGAKTMAVSGVTLVCVFYVTRGTRATAAGISNLTITNGMDLERWIFGDDATNKHG